MDAKTLKKQGKDQLERSLADAMNRLRELRASLAAKSLKDVREVRLVRREIARIRTVLQQLAGEEKSEK